MNSITNRSSDSTDQPGNEILVWGDNKYGQLGVGKRLSGFDFPKVS